MAALTRPHTSGGLEIAVLVLTLAACHGSETNKVASQSEADLPSALQRPEPPLHEQKREPLPHAAEPAPRPGMRFIPQTTFFAGVEPGSDDVEPGHETHAGPLYVDELEVTVEQYRTCTQTQTCQKPSESGRGCNYRQKGRDRHPMNCIDWYAADRFCRAQDKRLPTADEWQLAARGTDRRIYPWGKAAPDDQLCCRSKPSAKRSGTCEVGTHLPGDSPFGVHDMAGNVAEWTASKAAAAAGTAYEVYGGGYVVDAMETPEWREVRLDLPTSYAPTHAAPDVGFRCVSDPT